MAGPSLNLLRSKSKELQGSTSPQPAALTRLAQALFQKIFKGKIKQFQNIPGPTPLFPIGNALDLSQGKSIWDVFGDYAQTYGGLTLFWLLGRPCLVLNDPDLIADVLAESSPAAQSSGSEQTEDTKSSKCPFHNFRFYKDLPLKALLPIMTDTTTVLAPVDDHRWSNLHQNHPFTMDYFEQWFDAQLPTLATFIETRTEALVADSSQQGSLAAFEAIQKLTFDGFSLAMVGEVFPDQVFEQFNTLCQIGTQRMNRSTISNRLIPTQPWDPQFQKVSRQWFRCFDQVVQEIKSQSDGDSLLAWVMRQGGSNYTSAQYRNICAGVYPGGAISTPSGLTSTLHFLAQHPEILTSLQGELRDFVAGPLTRERLEACTQLDQVLRESLRLLPPVPFFMRNVNQGQATEIGGHSIPANTPIFINNWYLQRLSDHWSHPETFSPERWDAETCRQNDWGSDYFFPFGRNHRACIGQDFALHFMKLTLAVMLSKCVVEFGDQSQEREFFFGVAIPRQLRVNLVSFN